MREGDVKFARAIALGALLCLPLVAGCNDSGMDVTGAGRQESLIHGGDLWVADVETENWRKVPLEGGYASSPTWSPNGRYVLFELYPKAAENSGARPTAGPPAPPPPNFYAALFDTQTGSATQLSADI